MLEMRIEELEKVSRPRRSRPLRNSLPRSLEMQSCEDTSSEQSSGLGTWHSISICRTKDVEEYDPFVHFFFMSSTKSSWKGE